MQLSILLTGLLCTYEAVGECPAEYYTKGSISRFEAARPYISKIQSGSYTVQNEASLVRPRRRRVQPSFEADL